MYIFGLGSSWNMQEHWDSDLFCIVTALYKSTQYSTAAWSVLGKLMSEQRAEILTFFERIQKMTCVQNSWQKMYYTSFDTLCPPEFSKDVFWHTLSPEHPDGISIKWQIREGKRKTCFSPRNRHISSRSKNVLYRRGQNVKFIGKDATKNVTS